MGSESGVPLVQALRCCGSITQTVYYDSAASNFQDRSVYGDSLAGMTAKCCGVGGSHNLMIRAEIDPITHGAPVGGVVISVDKLAVFAPYLALFGVLTVMVIAAAPWNKPDTD